MPDLELNRGVRVAAVFELTGGGVGIRLRSTGTYLYADGGRLMLVTPGGVIPLEKLLKDEDLAEKLLGDHAGNMSLAEVRE